MDIQRTLSRFSFSTASVIRSVAGDHALRSALCSAAYVALLASAGNAAAQAYPFKSIRLIVPSAPGGGPDLNARLIANEIGKQMAQQVVVDNRPGASNIIGLEALARAAPDGYTFGYLSQNFVTNPGLFAKLPYDGEKDFQTVIMHGSSTFLLTVTPALPVRTVKDMIDYARANPGKLSYGGNGSGSTQTLSLELLKFQTGTNIVHVAYKGVQQAIADVIGGQIHIVCDSIASILPLVRSGRLRGLGVTTLERSPVAPELPTLDESGMPGFDVTTTTGYAVPAGVPHEIVMRLNAEINKALQSPTVAAKFAANGQTIGGGTPERYAEHIRRETEKWGKVIKAAGIKPE